MCVPALLDEKAGRIKLEQEEREQREKMEKQKEKDVAEKKNERIGSKQVELVTDYKRWRMNSKFAD
ncbi:hypothetical protein LguiB_007727 [Lonicera macranthoides]